MKKNELDALKHSLVNREKYSSIITSDAFKLPEGVTLRLTSHAIVRVKERMKPKNITDKAVIQYVKKVLRDAYKEILISPTSLEQIERFIAQENGTYLSFVSGKYRFSIDASNEKEWRLITVNWRYRKLGHR